VIRPVGKNNQPLPRPLHPESVNTLVQQAVARAGLDPPRTARTASAPGSSPTPTSAAPSDRAIAHQTRHRSLATVGTYVRIHHAWTDNAASALGL
jgi:hypothetical protein